MTGLVVGASLGALASPRLSEPGTRVGFVGSAEEAPGHGGPRAGEISVQTSGGARPHPAVTVPIEIEVAAAVTPAPDAATSTATTLAPTATNDPTTTTSSPSGQEPDPSPPDPTPPSTAAPVPPSTTPPSTTPPRPTLCSQLAPTREAKLDVAAELRPSLDLTGAARYDVVVRLEPQQSSSPAQEQQLRVASLANFAEVGAEQFSILDATHVTARLDSGQLCRLVFLRPVQQVQVRPVLG